MRKVLSYFSLGLAILATSISASAYDFEVDGIYYKITDSYNNWVKVTYKDNSYNSYSGSIKIPSIVTRPSNGAKFTVVEIDQYAFNQCSNLTSVVVPNTIKSLSLYTFYGCENLTSVSLPNTITSIGYSAFGQCPSLTSVNIPNSLTSIEDDLFYACSSLTSITIPNSVISIGKNAFSCCGLTSITIPESVTSIGSFAFSSCDDLTSFNIPESITTIAAGTFNQCKSLVAVTIPNSVTSIGGNAFYMCSNLTSIDIPSSVTSIGNGAFSGCSSLNTITIPNTVTSIGDKTFYYCTSLSSITIPNSVTSIGENAFYWCKALTSVSIPNSVTSIGGNAFYGCKALTSVSIPNSITSIGDGAFSSCSSLNSITLPNLLPTIGNNTFSWCDALTSVTIPNSVVSIGNCAFQKCKKLNSINLPESVTSIGESAFASSGINNIIIPTSVTSINDNTFDNCTSLTSVTIPNSVSSIGNCAFQNCKKLNSINLPESVTSIGKSAFASSGINNIIIPTSVTSINDNTFDNCTSLTSVTIPNSVTSIGESAFASSGITTIIIPNSVTSIDDNTFNNCSSLTSVTIPNSVTSIGEGAFSNCTSLQNLFSHTEDPSNLILGEDIFEIVNLWYATLYVIPGSKTLFNQIQPWSYFYSIVESISLDKYDLTLDKGESEQLNLSKNISSDNGTPTWTSSDLSVATVSQNGLVTGVEPGNAIITATWADYTVNCQVTVTGNVATISLQDGETYNAEYDKYGVNVNYTRRFGNTYWQALYVPFDMSYDEWSPYAEIAELYNVRGYDNDKDGIIDDVTIESNRLKEGSSIKPNTPYVIKAKTAGTFTFECKDKKLLAAPEEEGTVECSSTKYIYAFHGIYKEKTDVYQTGVYFLSKNNFIQAADETVKLVPNRAYLDITPKSGGYNEDIAASRAPKRIILVVDGETDTTGIENIQIETTHDDIYYDLMGRRVENPSRGIYIQNGRKIFFK